MYDSADPRFLRRPSRLTCPLAVFYVSHSFTLQDVAYSNVIRVGLRDSEFSQVERVRKYQECVLRRNSNSDTHFLFLPRPLARVFSTFL